MLKNIPAALLLVAVFSSQAHSFDISVSPEMSRGGEGMLVRITNTTYPNFAIILNGKKYQSYERNSNSREAFIPMGIETCGALPLVVKRKLLFITLEEKFRYVGCVARIIRTSKLNSKDETMRDTQRTVDKQQVLVISALNVKSKNKLWNGPLILPVKSRSTPNFAQKREGKTYSYFHKGIDLGGKSGTPVRAANDGVVAFTGECFNVYGNLVILDHGQGVTSCYFHMKKVLKKTGDKVSKNDLIGLLGSTGWSTGPHLHFGVYLQGEAVDPLWWIKFSGNAFE